MREEDKAVWEKDGYTLYSDGHYIGPGVAGYSLFSKEVARMKMKYEPTGEEVEVQDEWESNGVQYKIVGGELLWFSEKECDWYNSDLDASDEEACIERILRLKKIMAAHGLSA